MRWCECQIQPPARKAHTFPFCSNLKGRSSVEKRPTRTAQPKTRVGIVLRDGLSSIRRFSKASLLIDTDGPDTILERIAREEPLLICVHRHVSVLENACETRRKISLVMPTESRSPPYGPDGGIAHRFR